MLDVEKVCKLKEAFETNDAEKVVVGKEEYEVLIRNDALIGVIENLVMDAEEKEEKTIPVNLLKNVLSMNAFKCIMADMCIMAEEAERQEDDGK